VAAADEVEQRYRLLFERNWRRVFAYALRRSPNRAAADDVVADVFLTAWRRIGDIPDDYELAWLLAVARRVLANAYRGDARRDRLLARLHQAAPLVQAAEVEAAADDGETAEQVRTALGRLRDADAEILQLATWEQLPHAQIAVVLECTVNAVAIRLHRARQRLSEELAKEPGSPGQIEPTSPTLSHPDNTP
jgi:RNA polymerase sigma-70 factor (ECF subfamily)